jgi:hypothetical protein
MISRFPQLRRLERELRPYIRRQEPTVDELIQREIEKWCPVVKRGRPRKNDYIYVVSRTVNSRNPTV